MLILQLKGGWSREEGEPGGGGGRILAMEVVMGGERSIAAVIIVVRVRRPKSRQKEEYRVVAIKQTGIRALLIIGHTGQRGRQGRNPESSQ